LKVLDLEIETDVLNRNTLRNEAVPLNSNTLTNDAVPLNNYTLTNDAVPLKNNTLTTRAQNSKEGGCRKAIFFDFRKID